MISCLAALRPRHHQRHRNHQRLQGQQLAECADPLKRYVDIPCARSHHLVDLVDPKETPAHEQQEHAHALVAQHHRPPHRAAAK